MVSGDRLFSGSWDHSIKVFSIRSDRVPSEGPVVTHYADLNFHTSYVFSLHARDGILVSGSNDKTIAVWDIAKIARENNAPLAVLRGHLNSVDCLLMLSNERVVSASQDRSIRVWH